MCATVDARSYNNNMYVCMTMNALEKHVDSARTTTHRRDCEHTCIYTCV